MTRPIDETWEYYYPHGLPGFLAKHAGEQAYTGSFFEVSAEQPGDRARARLAAQAPAMARLLLKHEWHPADEHPDYCIECGNIRVVDGGAGHAADCALLAALRAAGVVE